MIFRTGIFAAHSGQLLPWKIDLEGLERKDWETLALMAFERLPPFGSVEGVPRGGLPFAEALEPYCRPGGLLLLADDVLTTGASLREQKGERDAWGVVVFARGPVPFWVTPLFRLEPTVQEKALLLAQQNLEVAGDRRDWQAADEAEEALEFLRRKKR